MSEIESIGARLYREVTTPVYSADGRYYTCGCISRIDGTATKVIFFRYEVGRGIVGRCKPSDDLAAELEKYGRNLMEYIQKMDMHDG